MSIEGRNAEPYKPTKMVVCGGGVKGRAYAPVIKALQETDILPGVTDVYGSSVGAILSSMLSLGFSPQQIQTQLDSDGSPYQDAAKAHSPKIPKLLTKVARNILKDGAVFKGEKLAADTQALVNQAGFNPNATFSDLQRKVDSGENSPTGMPYRNLHVTATVVDKRGSYQIILNSKTAPNMPIALAIRASAALPPAFRAVVITPEQMQKFTEGATEKLVQYDRGPAYHNNNGIDEGAINMSTTVKLIDGGLVDNLPQYVAQKNSAPNDDILSLNLRDPQYMKQKERYEGISLDPNNQGMCEKYEEKYRIEREALMPTIERAYKSSHKICYPPSRLLATRENTLDIPTHNVQAADFEMDDHTHQKLLDEGHTAVIEMLNKKGVDTSKISPAPQIIKPNKNQKTDELISLAKTELQALGLDNKNQRHVKKIAQSARKAQRTGAKKDNYIINRISKHEENFKDLNTRSNQIMGALKEIDQKLANPKSLSSAEKKELKQQQKELIKLNAKFKIIVKIFRYEQIESKSKVAGASLAKSMVKGLWKERRMSAEIKTEAVLYDAQRLLNNLGSEKNSEIALEKVQNQIREINNALKLLNKSHLPNKKEMQTNLNDIKKKLVNQRNQIEVRTNNDSTEKYKPATPSHRAKPITPSAPKIGESHRKARTEVQQQTRKTYIGKHRP